MSDIAELAESVVDVRDIAPQNRHTVVFQSFDRLAPGEHMSVVTLTLFRLSQGLAGPGSGPLRRLLPVHICGWTAGYTL